MTGCGLFDRSRGLVLRVTATPFVALLAVVVSACGASDEPSAPAGQDLRGAAPVEAEADGNRVRTKTSAAADKRSDLDELAAIDAKLAELYGERASTEGNVRRLEQETTSRVEQKHEADKRVRSLEEKVRGQGAGVRCLEAWVDRCFSAALLACRAAAGAGDPAAQKTLGHMYADGQGVTADPREAVSWYRGAAASGDAGAQYALARSYSEGKGVAKNLEVAVRWLRQAAAQNHNLAQVGLASAYQYGSGLEKNVALAYVWYSVAVESAPPDQKAQVRKFRDWSADGLRPDVIAAADEHVQSCLGALPRCDTFAPPS